MASQGTITIRSDEPSGIEYSDTIADRILHQVCEGALLREICSPDEMPDESEVRMWLRDNSEFSKRFDAAKLIQADTLFEEAIHIGRNSSGTYIARDKLQVETLLKAAAVILPNKYGDKKEIVAVVPVIINTSLDLSGLQSSTNQSYTIPIEVKKDATRKLDS